MRQRIVVMVVVLGFAAAVTGAAVVAGGGGHPASLPLLPLGQSQSSSGALPQPAAAGMAAPIFAFDYQVEGTLPKLADHAPAYTLGTDGGGERVDHLAAALGLHGRPQSDAQGWKLQDGTRVMSVQNQPGVPWTLFDTRPCQGGGAVPAAIGSVEAGPSGSTGKSAGGSTGAAAAGSTGGGAVGYAGGAVAGCWVAVAGPAVAVPAQGAAGTSTANCPPPPPCPEGKACPAACAPPPPPTVIPPTRPADLPTRDEAERLARDLLGRTAGPSLSGATTRVIDTFNAWLVEVDPVIDGLPAIGLQESVSVGPKGAVVSASGWLGTAHHIGDYPLAGVDKGLDRLRHGFGVGPVPLGAMAGAEARVVPAPPPLAPAPPAPALGVTQGAPPTGASAAGGATSADFCSGKEATGAGSGAPAIQGLPCPPAPIACPVPADSPPPPGAAPPARYPYCGEPVVRTITGVHLALELVPSFYRITSLPPTAHLEPAYVFELKGGGTTFPVPAVIDADLQPPLPQAPLPRPGPGPETKPPAPAPATRPAEPPTTDTP